MFMPPEAGRMCDSFFLMQFVSMKLLPFQCVLAIQIEQCVFDVDEGLLFLCHNDVILVPTVIVRLWGFIFHRCGNAPSFFRWVLPLAFIGAVAAKGRQVNEAGRS